MLSVAAAILAVVPPAEASAETSRLRVTHLNPLVVRGTGFSAREHVRVVVRSGDGMRSRAVKASAAGRFVVSFPTLNYDVCRDEIRIVATGTRHKAAAELPQRQCPLP